MEQRLREEEWLPPAVAVHVDIKESLEEELGLLVVIRVHLAGKLTPRPYCGNVAEMVRYLVVEVDVSKGNLPAAPARELVELKDELLCKL